ncbi:DUF2513 domain-containing protein [Companilactobacillus pabuli]|uniref:DUF2513 domain-containing protein n=1 Tax=Companilactobacillus pabuli TaxID=2714036 RepID=UPI00351382E5
MELNHDCVRDTLLAIEKYVQVEKVYEISNLYGTPELSKYEFPEVWYVLLTLFDAGFITTYKNERPRTFLNHRTVSNITGITFKGHEYLDNIRDPKVWKETKHTVLKTVASASLSIFSAVASKIVSSKLGL